MKRSIVVAMAFALLLTIAIVAIPRPVAAQLKGGYVDEIVFSVVDQPQAVIQTSAADIDLYIFRLDVATDVVAAKDDPNVNVEQAYSGFRGLIVNPAAPADGSFNPFTIREIREAMHWAVDRDFMITEYGGGQGVVKIASQAPVEPNYVRDAPFFATLEAKYSFDMERARTQINNAMARVAGATFDTATEKWLVNGNPINLIIISRLSPDPRFDIGEHMRVVLEDFGFNAITEPSTFERALDVVYFSPADLGQWHMYTEGWGSTGFVQFDDTNGPFFYNGDFGSAIWDDYVPPASLSIPCQALEDGNYLTLAERSELLTTCEEEGMREGVRQFLWQDLDSHISSVQIDTGAYDIFSGFQNPYALRTTKVLPGASRPATDPPVRADGTGGTLRVAQPIHGAPLWSAYGYTDVYSVYQHWAVYDYGTYTHPHLGVVTPIRADFAITTVGPASKVAVPADAWFFNTTSNKFEQVGTGLQSQSYVDYTYTWGEWHHGAQMSMDDIYAQIAFISRVATGDIGALNPSIASETAYIRWAGSFRAFNVTGPDTIRVWYDTYNPDITLIASRADVWPFYPWELHHIIAESAIDPSGTRLSPVDARTQGLPGLDLAKGTDVFADLQLRLDTEAAAGTIPGYLTGIVDPGEAAARWTALSDWRTRKGAGCTDGPGDWTCGFTVSNGPYILDTYFSAPEGAVYTAKRVGYPFDVDRWDFLADIRVPTITLGTPPQVVQTFPATWSFTSSLAGQAYDRLQTRSWLVFDPATRELLFSGEAVRVGPGNYEVRMTAEQTSGLAEGTYELRTIVVGEEAALPVITSRAFSTLSLRTAILTEVTNLLSQELATVQDSLDANTGAINDARAAADDAARLANILLVIASVAVVVAVVSLVVLMVVWRRLPKQP